MRFTFLASMFAVSLAACGDPAPTPAGPDAGAPPSADARLLPATCSNGVKDNDETDVDCGGGCGATCAVGAACTWHDDCDHGICAELPAKNHSEGARVCHARVEACAPGACGDAACRTMQTNLTEGGPDTDVAYCAPLQPIGAYCEQPGDKDLRACVAGAACVEAPGDPFSYQCVAATTPIGAACSDDTCVPGAFCDHGWSPSTCKALKPEGASCMNTFECGAGLHCDDFRGKCEKRAAIGEACFDGEAECQPGAHCAFPSSLACENWVQCGSQMDCCATATGSECRPFDGHTHCAPPTGACAAGNF